MENDIIIVTDRRTTKIEQRFRRAALAIAVKNPRAQAKTRRRLRRAAFGVPISGSVWRSVMWQ